MFEVLKARWREMISTTCFSRQCDSGDPNVLSPFQEWLASLTVKTIISNTAQCRLQPLDSALNILARVTLICPVTSAEQRFGPESRLSVSQTADGDRRTTRERTAGEECAFSSSPVLTFRGHGSLIQRILTHDDKQTEIKLICVGWKALLTTTEKKNSHLKLA
ncbi:hypothetical protein JOB18_002542 [Solea senegalensis]|uniref:Uncharacterized protein n=1 Tax=Solea senegalensis TaxID=28829 RepID=A0AAV6S906_SOLSE|nr:hypothetical protein JOB18_002542 [Solea senegalensis]